MDSVSRFLDEHDRALEFVARNPNASPVHPEAGDQTWLFSEGRYRIFFKIVGGEEDLLIFLTHLIDNREANLPIYPGNKMPTFSESNED